VSTVCSRTQRGLMALLAVLVVGSVTQARAELAGDVAQFLQDYDRLVAVRAQIDADRTAMLADINDHKALKADVQRFFADRLEAFAARLSKAADRKQMRIDLDFKSPKLEKPAKGTGVLAQDAANYIANYDAWVALQQQVEVDIAAMRNILSGVSFPEALANAVTAFFTDSRARLQKRLQWQQDIRSMKKDLGFKGTGKPVPPPGTGLKDDAQKFLNDRGAWEAYGPVVEADRNNLRAAVQGGQSLDSIVTTFLTDRRARHIKGVELALDRKAMRKDLGLKNAEKELKQGAAASSKDLDKDDESDSMEETPDTAGEK